MDRINTFSELDKLVAGQNLPAKSMKNMPIERGDTVQLLRGKKIVEATVTKVAGDSITVRASGGVFTLTKSDIHNVAKLQPQGE